VLTFGDRKVVVTGLDDLVAGQPNFGVGESGSGAPNSLLLGHCPALRDVPAAQPPQNRRGIALMLSGHTHAGQFAPFGWAPLRPYGSGRYVAGWYRDENRWPLYVSRGIGTSIVPVRFFAPPEIAVFEVSLHPG
jgi:predicted MPP superfamily phosphohydrolase